MRAPMGDDAHTLRRFINNTAQNRRMAHLAKAHCSWACTSCSAQLHAHAAHYAAARCTALQHVVCSRRITAVAPRWSAHLETVRAAAAQRTRLARARTPGTPRASIPRCCARRLGYRRLQNGGTVLQHSCNGYSTHAQRVDLVCAWRIALGAQQQLGVVRDRRCRLGLRACTRALFVGVQPLQGVEPAVYAGWVSQWVSPACPRGRASTQIVSSTASHALRIRRRSHAAGRHW